MNELLNKIEKRKAEVNIICLGYIVFPLACEIAKSGFNVLEIYKDKSKVDVINRKEMYYGNNRRKYILNSVA